MFGKKKPNPDIEVLDTLFKDRLVNVNYVRSESFVNLGLKEFTSVAKMTRSLIFKYIEHYPVIMYALVGPDNFLYFTEIEKQVKAR